jgi:hypothetical protein
MFALWAAMSASITILHPTVVQIYRFHTRTLLNHAGYSARWECSSHRTARSRKQVHITPLRSSIQQSQGQGTPWPGQKNRDEMSAIARDSAASPFKGDAFCCRSIAAPGQKSSGIGDRFLLLAGECERGDDSSLRAKCGLGHGWSTFWTGRTSRRSASRGGTTRR